MKFNFEMINSNRFQALVVIALVYILQQYGILPHDIAMAFYTVLGGHIGIKTIDRFSEKVADANNN